MPRQMTVVLRTLALSLAFATSVVSHAGRELLATERPQTQSVGVSLTSQIDTYIRAGWEANQVEPAPICSDEVFVRRAFLDLLGRIPTTSERQAFLEDDGDARREVLIDQLLASDDYAVHFADTFDTLLMGRGSRKDYDERVSEQWRPWLERVFRENRPWDDVVADMLLARPKSPADRGAVWFLFERNNNHQAIAEAVAPAIFGIRVDCAQCHDHMIASEIEQQHYWGLVAFFNRGKNERTGNGPRIIESAVGGFSEFANLEGSSSPNLLTFYGASTVSEQRPEADAKQEDNDDLYVASEIEGEPRKPKFSRREKFVTEIVREHPLIARAVVNRVWAMLMGRGIVHPFDQMDSVHDPSHPELLDALAEDFRNHDYDLRRLVRSIVLCQAYQLDSRPPAGGLNPASFAWYLPRPLTAEQLARSMQVALRRDFENGHPLVGQIREKMPEVMPETFVTNVGEALFLSNNPAVNQFVADSCQAHQWLGGLMQLDDMSEVVQSLFVAVLGRRPDREEAVVVGRFLDPRSSDRRPDDVNESIDAEEKQPRNESQRLQHAAWALITSAEFRLNH